MAEIEIPKVSSPTQSSLTRETSSLTVSTRDVPKIDFKGEVSVKKPSKFDRFKSVFISDDAKDVGTYILWDIVIPTIRRTIRDVIVGSADRIFLGASGPAPSSMYRERGNTYVRHTDYTRPSSRSIVARNQEPQPVYSKYASRTNFHLNDIVFKEREDAEAVLEQLVNYIDTYGRVSVDFYFSIIGTTTDYTAQNWGWTDLSDAIVQGTLDGYFIRLPNPVVIK